MPTRTCRAKHFSLLFLSSSSSRRTPVKWSTKLGPPECLNLAQHPGDRNLKPPFPRLRLYRRPEKRSTARCFVKISSRGDYLSPVSARIASTQFDRYTRARA